MKKFLLAGASTLAILGFAGGANAQLLDVSVDIGDNIEGLFDIEDFAGVYANAAVNVGVIDGSVNIDAASLIPGLNASSVSADIEASLAAAVATGGIDVGLDVLVPGLDIGVGGLAIAAAGATQIGLDIVGNRISSTAELATTAIGSVNEGTIALASLSTRDFTDASTDVLTGGSADFVSSAANSASNTSNTAAAAAASATSLLLEEADRTITTAVTDIQSTGPASILAANLSANIALIDGAVNLTGATINDIAGTATTAIGAVNTGTISNGLPGTITIVVGGDE